MLNFFVVGEESQIPPHTSPPLQKGFLCWTCQWWETANKIETWIQASTAMYVQKYLQWGKCRKTEPPGCSKMNVWPSATKIQQRTIALRAGGHSHPPGPHEGFCGTLFTA
jgi:hypothetical protein